MNKDEIIKELLEQIEEKNREIDRLHIQYQKIVRSRTWKYANYIRKAYRCIRHPKLVLRKLGLINKNNHYSNFNAYNSSYEENEDFSLMKTDIKAIAFYLPQFHTFKENDEWWGKGFTEWTNTKKSIPRYKNHYQPREPHDDIGYYDLSNIDILKKQVELAKQHGLYGFCFYYYWFSGKRLMEKPVDMLLEHKEINFPFCLCWANENWTRAWDGMDKEVLIAQNHTKDDPKKFIRDIKKYVIDSRYIKVDGKPVIMIYNPAQIPNVEKVINEWRQEAKEQGIGEIYIITRNLILDDAKEIKNCDAEFDFAPLQKGFSSCVISGVKNGNIYDYNGTVKEMIDLYRNHNPKRPFYYTSTMGWDNSSRRKDGFTVFHHYSLEGFYNWNREIIRQTRIMNPKQNRFMFINAWNEWCEGTYLDPDKKYGYANINTLSKALFDMPFKRTIVATKNDKIFPLKGKKIAVQIHLFHIDLIDEIIEQLNNIPYDFDCFITTNNNEKKEKIYSKFTKKCKSSELFVTVSKNRGRDVAPFLIQISPIHEQYDYICHIHTKKSTTTEYGDNWRKYLYQNLFGSEKNVSKIFEIFENNKNIGIIYPCVYPVIAGQTITYGINQKNCLKQFKRLNIPKSYINEKLVFPAGTMFWAKVDAIKPLFEANYCYNDFSSEKGQLDSTPAHAIERIICTLAETRGYTYANIHNNTLSYEVKKKKRLVLFAHYEDDATISKNDMEYIKKLKEYANKVLVVSNQKLNANKNVELNNIIDEWLTSTGKYDFELWKEALNLLSQKEIKKYDEVVFANNNRMITNISFNKIFSEVEDTSIEALCFHKAHNEHDFDYVDSDFMIIPTNILLKDNVYKLFTSSSQCESIEEKNKNYNVELTKILKKEKIELKIFIEETKYADKYLINGSLDHKSPFLMLLLNSPLIEKESFNYILSAEDSQIADFIKQCK